jgi:predicted  nucleic acid-binding Zn-ribbon protein
MDLGRLIERKLQEARDSGAFDALTRKGALNLDEEAETGVPEDDRLAFKILKNNDMAPAWIEDDKVLREKLNKARTHIQHAHKRWQVDLARATTAGERLRVGDAWQNAKDKFEKAVEEINRDIFNFNLNAPSLTVHRMPLRVSEEYERLARQAASTKAA